MLLHITTHNDMPQWHRKKLTRSPLGLSGVALHSSSAQISDYGCCSESTLKYWWATEKRKRKKIRSILHWQYLLSSSSSSSFFSLVWQMYLWRTCQVNEDWTLNTQTQWPSLLCIILPLGELKAWRLKYLLRSTHSSLMCSPVGSHLPM